MTLLVHKGKHCSVVIVGVIVSSLIFFSFKETLDNASKYRYLAVAPLFVSIKVFLILLSSPLVSYRNTYFLLGFLYQTLDKRQSNYHIVQINRGNDNERRMTNSNMKKRISGIAKGNKTNLTQNDGCLKTVDDTISHQKTYNILIVTRGRSGSSFLGDLLNSYPGSFYIFEPLHKKNEYERMNKKTIKGNKVIESIFKCKLPELHIYNFNIWRNFGSYKKLKEKASIWKTSKEKSKASNQIFYNSCKKFPKTLVKTIRLPFEDAEYLLLDPEIGKNLKVIFLFRDPRGRYQSLISKVGLI